MQVSSNSGDNGKSVGRSVAKVDRKISKSQKVCTRLHFKPTSKKATKLVLEDAIPVAPRGSPKIASSNQQPSKGGPTVSDLLQGLPNRWISFNIEGIRARVVFTTYDTWQSVPLLPAHTPWAWAGLSKAETEGLMPLEVVAQFSNRINERLNSPTACYIDAEAAASPAALPGSADVLFSNFFHDQQDCVLWSAVGPAGAEVVVAHHEPIESAADFRANVKSIIEPAGVEAFLYRMYLEGAVWHARSEMRRERNQNEMLPEDVWVYEQLLIETHKNDPKLSFKDAFKL